MPKKRASRTPPEKGSPAAGKTVLAFVLGAGAAAGAGYLYLHSAPHSQLPSPSAPPAQTGTPSPPAPPAVQPKAPSAPIRLAPFGISEDVFEAGARTYSLRCASCHGTPQKDASFTPAADQLWRKARRTLPVETPGDVYNQISVGAPSKGMPAYARTLTETQIWQLALLLQNAGQDLPDPVLAILNAPHTKR